MAIAAGSKWPSDRALAHTALRILLGVNIAAHGLARIGHLGAFSNELVRQFAATPLPAFAVRAFGLVLPPAELLIGSTLLLGIALRSTLIAAALLMTALTFGTCLRQQWDVAGLQLIYALAYSWLLAHLHDAWLTLDGLRRLSRRPRRHAL